MSVEQLLGKYKRLQGELSRAYTEPDWNQARVDRIADEIAQVEREIAVHAPIGLRGPAGKPGDASATA